MAEGYDLSHYKDQILDVLPRGNSLLEIGMGPGNDFAWMSELYEMTGSDYSPLFIEKAKKRFPGADLVVLDGISLPTERRFDALYSCKVYQHIPLEKFIEVLDRQWQILNPGGVIIHSFWIGDKIEDMDDMRFYYHNEALLTEAIESKFNIVYREKYTEFEEGDSLFLIGVKRNAHNV